MVFANLGHGLLLHLKFLILNSICILTIFQLTQIIVFFFCFLTKLTHISASGDQTRDLSYWRVFTHVYPSLRFSRRDTETFEWFGLNSNQTWKIEISDFFKLTRLNFYED